MPPDVAIYSHPIFYRHQTGLWHPESPERLDAAFEGVARVGAAALLHREAAVHDDTDRIIATVHSAGYALELANACREGQRLFHSVDNPISTASYDAARTAVGVALTAAHDVWKKEVATRAFVIARPPGHHAEQTQAMGFCFFNTIACVTEALLESPTIQRVFIFDWDVHHGNGTQHIFEEREDVFYVSLHRYPFFPGTGSAGEIGIGRGRGFTRNVPFDAHTGDATYLRTVEEVVIPLLDEYRPDAILISAGFDAHRRDPIGEMGVTEQAFGEMSRRMIEAAERHTGGRLLSLLEGGYDAEGLASSVSEHLLAMNGSR